MWVHADTAPGSGPDKFPPSGKKNIVFMVSDGTFSVLTEGGGGGEGGDRVRSCINTVDI